MILLRLVNISFFASGFLQSEWLPNQLCSYRVYGGKPNRLQFFPNNVLRFFGATGAIAFRAVNTLDGMVGFKDKENINLGWFSANLDHVINLVPSRLTGAIIIASAFLLREELPKIAGK